MNEVRYLRQPAERRRCPPIGGRLSLPYFSSARLASPFAEIGRNPRRDRSYSESRSVHFRPEIGRNPCRDRSGSAGLLCVDGSEVRHAAFALELVVRASTSGWPGRAGPISVRGVVGDTWWASVVFGVAHGCHEDTGRATPRPSNPPHTTPNPKNHTTGNHHTPHTHPPQMPSHTTTPTQNRTDLDAEYDRSQAGTGPISTRSTTDLNAELDRSRGGCQAAYVIPRRRPSHSIWSAIATDHVAQVCLPA